MYTEKEIDFFVKNAFVDSALLHAFLRLKIPAYLSDFAKEGPTLTLLSTSLQLNARAARLFTEVLCASHVLALDDQQRLTIHPELQPVLASPEALERLERSTLWWWPVQQLTTAIRTGEPVQTADGQRWDLLAYYDQQLLSAAAQPDDAFERLFDRVARNFLRTQLFVCVAQLHLLPCFYQQEQTLSQLQAHCHAHQQGLAILLAILVQFGLLQQRGDTYTFSPYFAQKMNKTIIKAYTYSWGTSAMFWEVFGHLEDVLHSGEQHVFNLQDQKVSNTFYRELVKQNTLTFPSYYRITRQIAERISQLRSLEHCTMLDVGAGSGAWGGGFIAVEPSAQVTFLDQQLVIPQTKSNLEKVLASRPPTEDETAGQVRFWIDDVRSAEYGDQRFDIIILAFVCHTQPLQELPDLFARLGRALRPGGLLLIADWCLNDQRIGPLELLYFSFKEFVTTQGELLSLKEYRQMLGAVALKILTAFQVAGFDLLLVGHPDTAISIPQDFSW